MCVPIVSSWYTHCVYQYPLPIFVHTLVNICLQVPQPSLRNSGDFDFVAGDADDDGEDGNLHHFVVVLVFAIWSIETFPNKVTCSLEC